MAIAVLPKSSCELFENFESLLEILFTSYKAAKISLRTFILQNNAPLWTHLFLNCVSINAFKLRWFRLDEFLYNITTLNKCHNLKLLTSDHPRTVST